MPLPLLIAAGVAAAGYGVKKGLDAKEDFDEAESVNRRARRIYEEAEEELEDARGYTNERLEDLGKTKLVIYKEVILPCYEHFNKIKNFEKKNHSSDSERLNSNKFELLLDSPQQALEISEIASGGIVALGAGGLAGLASYGAVGTLATASTGASIAGLSGVAATNATLAWLGGGALSAGGMGMAGGMAVLGGIVAGPVLAVGGLMASSKAEEAKNDAHTNLYKSKLAVEEMKTATTITQGIAMRVVEIEDTVNKLKDLLVPDIPKLREISNRKKWFIFSDTNFENMTLKDKEVVVKSYKLVETLFNVLEAKLLDQDGALNNESKRAISNAVSILNSNI